jgi:hypothetical protein
MTKLNQVIALEKGTKTEVYAKVTKLHHDVQKAALLSGISRTYQPLDDEGEQFPPESTRVQVRATDVLNEIAAATSRLFDLTLTKDFGNTTAFADIKVGDEVIAEKVPVTTLLFLEKQLTDIATIVAKLPVLDPAEEWRRDDNTDLYATVPAKTVKSKKIPRNHVKAAATDKHPAQVEVWMEDVVVGNWTTTKFSDALPASRINQLKERVRLLQEAVKLAREEANSTQVTDRKMGESIFDYIFG